jgi:pSer/pThr/pTyr-binding forkhead associated (FHA) protein
MIETTCQCGAGIERSESSCGEPFQCASCGQTVSLIAAEALPENSGAGDFDARLIVIAGPDHVGEQYLLGGVPPITVGKLPERNISLGAGKRVSRHHCTLNRLDFGPSRWEIQDNKSTFGLFVNGERVETQELQNGDVMQMGEYELEYRSTFADDVAMSSAAMATPTAVHTPPTAPPGRKLAYAGPKTASRHERPMLGDCPIEWVMHLRNASTLMLWSINVRLLATFFLPKNIPLIDVGVDALTALMGAAAAFLLTMPEPGAPESKSWFSVRFALRLAALATAIGELTAVGGTLLEDESMLTAGALLALMVVPQTFLFLFYLRRLAKRIPNEGLAINAVIVMIGLPLTLLAVFGGAVLSVMAGSSGLLLLSGFAGLIGLLVFRIWYIALLVWFNRSFS